MKKSVLKILALAMCATTLSGCDLLDNFFGDSSLPEETREFYLSLKDYTKTVEKNKTYEFDGKVFVVYQDDQSEKEVTSLCKYSTIDTSSLGEKEFRVDYETKKLTKYITTKITVVEASVLDSIELKNYATSTLLGEAYTFEGSIVAHYTNGSEKVVTSSATIDISSVNINVVGTYSISVSYTEDGINKTATAEISVVETHAKLTKIEAKEYSGEVEKGTNYKFDGKVIATFEGGETQIVTDNCTFGTISTSSTGSKSLSISYKDTFNNITKSTTASIKVISTLTSISGTPLSVGEGRSVSVALTYTPSDATYKDVSYVSNNTSVATVDSEGLVKGISKGATTITVTSTKYSGVSCDVAVTVTDAPTQDAWTILIYMCGSNLESGWDDLYQQYNDYGAYQASADLDEIKSVKNKPDDVNIVVEAGGAKRWKSSYQSIIDKDKLNRFHLGNNGSYVLDEQITRSDMGSTSTLQSFIEWGIKEYPAEKMALIFWNHGGGLLGCCNDELSGGELLDNEVLSAVSGAFNKTGVSKFEWVGYDCCLMQMMEIAEFNAPYFNYQIASQETEAGSGWDYDTWVDDLYAKKSTENILKAIVDGFIEDNGGVDATGYNYYGTYYPADQTLSYLDLSKISEFKTAWESLATQLKSKITNSNKSIFKSDVVGASKYFAGADYEYYAEFDCYDFLDKLSENSTFNPGGNYISNARTALTNLIKYNIVQEEGAADAHGLSFYFGKTYNSSTYSDFTNWVSLVNTVGGFEYSSGGWDDWGWGW